MGSIQIYFRSEIEKKLRKEDNMAGLINALLEEHYQKMEGKSKEELQEEINRIKEKENQLKENLSEREKAELEELNKSQEKEKRTKEAEEAYMNSDERWSKIREIQKHTFFKLYKNPTEELFEEYFEMLKTGKVKNLIEFAEAKALKKVESKRKQEE